MALGKSKSGNKQLVPVAGFSPGYPPRREIQDADTGTVWPFYGGVCIGQETPIATAPATTKPTPGNAGVIDYDLLASAMARLTASTTVKRGRPVGSRNKVSAS